MFKVHSIFGLLLLIAESDFGPLRSLLAFCLNEENERSEGHFTVSGFDSSLNRDVTLDFTVKPDGESLCALSWLAPYEKNSLTKIIDRENGDTILAPKRLGGATGIVIHVYGKNRNTHWSLETLFPNGFVSGAFIRSFIVQAMEVHSEVFEDGMAIPLRVTDSSKIREQYWLEKGIGKTYYEGEWNLEYECLKKMNTDTYYHLKEYSAIAQDRKAIFDFLEDKSTFHKQHRLGGLFWRLLQDWKNKRSSEELESITIRQFIQEFTPLWKAYIEDDTFEKSPSTRQEMSRLIFVYFFHDDQLWELLARQVLSNYAGNCFQMIGYPTDLKPRQLTFAWNSGRLHSDAPVSIEMLHFPNLVEYFALFTLFSCFFTYFGYFFLITIRQKKASRFDTYIEL